LVTINQTQPINVGFAVPQTELGALRRALASKATADVIVADGPQATVVRARIGFVDNQVDRTTGTVMAKVVADNGEEVLWPGQSVEVALTVEVRARMLSVPAGAGGPGPAGMIAWGIGAGQKGAPPGGAGGRDAGAHGWPGGVYERRPHPRRARRHGWPDPPGARRTGHHGGPAPGPSEPRRATGRAGAQRQRQRLTSPARVKAQGFSPHAPIGA